MFQPWISCLISPLHIIHDLYLLPPNFQWFTSPSLSLLFFFVSLPPCPDRDSFSVQEALGAESVSDCVLSFVEMLLPVLLGLLKSLDPAQGDAHLRKLCQRITHVTGLLLDILHVTQSACCLCVFVCVLKPWLFHSCVLRTPPHLWCPVRWALSSASLRLNPSSPVVIATTLSPAYLPAQITTSGEWVL